jgi:hypothetical protein
MNKLAFSNRPFTTLLPFQKFLKAITQKFQIHENKVFSTQ